MGCLDGCTQVYGWDKDNTDGHSNLSLSDFERVNVRLIIGINF